MDKRIEWVDLVKGITILLVIVGHTLGTDDFERNLLRGMIFSFHMPLFFIMSGYTYRFSCSEEEFFKKAKKAFRYLIIPAIVLYIIKVFINAIHYFNSIKWNTYIAEKINVWIYASGVDVKVQNSTISGIGILWFLIVLFVGRTLSDYVHLKMSNRGKNLVRNISILSCIVGIICSKVQWLPLSFDIVLAIMPFFFFGDYLKKVDMCKKKLIRGSLAFGIWGIAFLGGFITNQYMELACRRYTCFPLCYIAAVAATMFISYLCVGLSKYKVVTPLIYLGKNSMYMLWIHVMDYTLTFVWKSTESVFLNVLLRVVVDICLFSCFMYLKTKWGVSHGLCNSSNRLR